MFHFRLTREFDRFQFMRVTKIVDLDKGALEAKALNLLHAHARHVARLKGNNPQLLRVESRRDDATRSVDNFRFKEGRLIQKVEAVAVVSANFNRDKV